MVWSNWQGAIWRGAMLVVLFWSGLAWTQTPVQRPAADPSDRIMVVHENGKATRCRVQETWQLPDGRVANLLQALETGELITIVDEQAPSADQGTKNPHAMPKRIFAWGQRRTPPEGSPTPPHIRIDSGAVASQQVTSPREVRQVSGPAIVNHTANEKATPGALASNCEGPCGPPSPSLFNRLFGKKEVLQNCTPVGNPQVLTFQKPKTAEPQIVQTGAVPTPDMPLVVQAANPIDNGLPQVIQAGNPIEKTGPQIIQTGGTPPAAGSNLSVQAAPLPANPVVIQGTAPLADATKPAQPGSSGPAPMPSYNPATTNAKLQPFAASPSGAGVLPAAPISAPPSAVVPASDPKVILNQAIEPDGKKPWRPGAKLYDWFTGKSQTTVAKTESVKPAETKPAEPKPVEPKALEHKSAEPKSADAKNVQKTEEYLAQENKFLEKKLQEKTAKMYNGPFSTAMGTPPLDMKKAEASPLAIPNPMLPKDDRATEASPGAIKQTNGPGLEKRDMWGLGLNDSVLPPGKSVLDRGAKPVESAKVPPLTQTRAYDPLTMPERFNDKTRRASVLGPIPSSDMNMMPGDPAQGHGWPLGTQSVMAARGGLQGPVTYVPVPTVTVPQPFNPPQPPEPNLPDAPQLNAYVNAFSPPPQPKGVQQYPAQGIIPAQAMNPYTQQQMMQQQMYQQQMMQQQAMYPYAYRPNMAPMMPYGPQVASQGPAMNFSRQYTGPQAPNLIGPGPVMPVGYAPMPYPPMMAPQQPMMPQNMVQPISYQQPMPAPAPVPTTHGGQQVEQLIKVLRESPYPAQREWAAQSLTSFEWRMHPQIVPNLLQSASQDPAPSVRAGCVYCLGRMQAAVEPVFSTLHALRNDIDPRVRQEVEQTFVRLGQTPMAPQQ